MTNYTPGTKIIVDLPFEKKPFFAVISNQKPPENLRGHCYRIEAQGGSSKGRVINVDMNSVKLAS